jgi:hypothetical protein
MRRHRCASVDRIPTGVAFIEMQGEGKENIAFKTAHTVL